MNIVRLTSFILAIYFLMQESLCAEAASFDLPSSLLTACISEAKNCIDLSVARRDTSNDTTYSPDDFAILRGISELLPDVSLMTNS